MENFTPLSGTVGGMLIGVAATLLLVANGRIAGISGIVGGILTPARGDVAWRVLFVSGLWLGSAAYLLVEGVPASLARDISWTRMAIAGALVGVGTRMGGGCTSGHGVCGIARRSKRSIVATVVFMATAMLTVYIARHVLVTPR